MPSVKEGDTVKVHYTGKFNDGTVFDSSRDRSPLEFIVGARQMIPGFDNAVDGMKPGETKTVTVPPSEAYGKVNRKLVLTAEKKYFPDNISLEIGKQLRVPQEDGTSIVVTITEMTDDTVTVDGNHPLAGKDLTFEIELLEIV